MAEKLNLTQKLTKIRSISDVVAKDKRGYNYTYADITAILAKITTGMKKYNVSLIPQIVPGTFQVSQNVTTNTKVDKTGKVHDNISTEMLIQAEMIFRWVDDDTAETLDVPWVLVGSQSDPSQAYGSALTYCTRYFLTSFFQIAQPDTDVDTYRTKQKEAEVEEDKYLAGEIIQDFDATLKEYLADNPDKSDDVKQFLSRYAKGSNYFSIKEPSLAGKLVNDFKEKFLKEEE